KTTLARKIHNPNADMPTEDETTEGIVIQPYEFSLSNGKTFRLNIWDFGGQEIYHNTHQFFLTKRSLYALVADTRRNDTEFYWWLNTVELLSDNSPVFVLKNQKDDRTPQLDEPALRERFDNLKDFHACNLGTNENLDKLIHYIQFNAEALPHIGDTLPKTWVKVREALEHDTCNTISQDTYLQLCTDNGFTRRSDALQLSDYLHDLGVFLHFQDDPVLKHTVILNTQWGTDAVYKILDDKQVQGGQHGCFNKTDDIQRIWQADEYQGLHDELLQLMKNFELCYDLPEANHYIAPQLLPKQRPDDLHWNNQDNLILRYVYKFMPKGILNRLVVRLHKLIEADRRRVWKHGVVLSDETAETRAKLEEKIA
ncbi:MAG: COR domain-containing protein, partial [Myxococcota bacterium]